MPVDTLSLIELPGIWILRAGTLAELRRALEPRMTERPDRIVHYDVVDAAIVEWYADQGLGRGLVLSGVLGGRGLRCRLLELVPPELFEDPAARVQLTVEYRAWGVDLAQDVGALSPRRLGALWFETDGLGRRVLLERLSAGDADPELAEDVHLLAMLDWDPALRKLAATRPIPSVERLLAALAAPLAILDRVGERPRDLDPDLARRNARYAALFSLANRSRGGALGAIEDALSDGRGWSEARDRWLYGLAASEVEGAPDRPHAAGGPEPLTLFDLCRLVVHRGRALSRRDPAARDRFLWLSDSVATIAPRPGARGTPSPASERLYAPSPEESTPP